MRQGTIHLFRFAGVDLFLHWSWFLVAMYEIQARSGSYPSLAWNVIEYLALFFIVMLHEYGHALACRSVGGKADRIVLWPLGGVAFVDPPPRPGATLWSIAAGPLVNVALLILMSLIGILNRSAGWNAAYPNAHALLRAVWFINAGLLIFNLLPIYPLDGGQILRSLLWYFLGRARSLMLAVTVGFAGVAGLVSIAVWLRSVWFGILAAFILMNCWGGLRQAQALARLAKLPRHEGFACPNCHASPPVAQLWVCGRCHKPFDTFQSQATCPNCGEQFSTTRCPDCGAVSAISDWRATALAGTKL
ncbi:MAG: site-2 protease family protein [Terriglobia bacterium]